VTSNIGLAFQIRMHSRYQTIKRRNAGEFKTALARFLQPAIKT
jgi:hypothetical protein